MFFYVRKHRTFVVWLCSGGLGACCWICINLICWLAQESWQASGCTGVGDGNSQWISLPFRMLCWLAHADWNRRILWRRTEAGSLCSIFFVTEVIVCSCSSLWHWGWDRLLFIQSYVATQLIQVSLVLTVISFTSLYFILRCMLIHSILNSQFIQTN